MFNSLFFTYFLAGTFRTGHGAKRLLEYLESSWAVLRMNFIETILSPSVVTNYKDTLSFNRKIQIELAMICLSSADTICDNSCKHQENEWSLITYR